MPSAFADSLLPSQADVLAQQRTNIFRPAAFMQRVELLLDILTGCASLCLTAAILSASSQGSLLPGSFRHALAACLLFVCLLMLFLSRSGAYRLTGGLLGLRETECVLRAVFSLFTLIIPCALLFSSRKALLAIFIEAPTLAILLVLEKQALNKAHDWLPSLLFPRQRVLIYGTQASARMVVSALQRSAKLRMWPVAVVTTGIDGADGNGFDGGPYASDLPHYVTEIRAEMLREHGADVVLMTDPPRSPEVFQHVLQESNQAGAQVVLRAFGPMQDAATSIDYLDLDGQIVYGPHQRTAEKMQAVCSRVLDLVGAGLLLVLLSPVLAITAAFVRLDSDGPIFFRQKRIGLNGVPFTIFKFRTMRIEHCGSGVSPSASSDPRITRVGRLLRKTSIDELPQLWNVMRGEMALVGPRPEMPFIVEQYTAAQRTRLAAIPGVTGVWQLSADRNRPIHENVHYDLYYLKHRSPFFDIAILLHTVFFAMRGI